MIVEGIDRHAGKSDGSRPAPLVPKKSVPGRVV
jgi:hypothetical protein